MTWPDLAAVQQPPWPDAAEVERAVAQLRALPPLVFAGECDLHGNREYDLHGGNIGYIQAGRRPCGYLLRGRLLGRYVTRGGGGAIGHG